MAYKLLYNDELLFDPYSDNIVTDAQLTSKYNNPDYFDFTVPITNDLYNKLSERSGSIKLFYDDEKIFDGIITSIDVDIDGNKSIKCSGALDYLNDTLVRPYATKSGESQTLAPDTISGIFQWYIDQHNKYTMDPKKHFSVGVNQGAMLSENNVFSRKSDSLPTTWGEIKNAILDDHGGFIFVEYSGNSNVLNLYGDIHKSNAQIIDFGVNITDFSKTTDTTDQYTAIRPSGYTPEAPENDPNKKMYPITISDLPDNPFDSDLVKKGDVIYSISAVQRYGYKEYAYSNNDITDTNNLLKSAAVILKTLISPAETITVKAVDLALYMNGYKHLRVGQAVRIRSKLHSTDEYMMVNSIVLDINNPSNTEYELGIPYDTLTGQQSSYLKNLNSSINSAIDSVAGLDQVSKDTAKKAEDANNTANAAKDTADTAKNTADTANATANKAQTTANNAQNTANNASSKAAEAKETADNASSKADQAQNAADKASLKAAEAKTTADGKNKVFTKKMEPAHTGLTKGDLWQKLDSSGHISSVNVWNGTKFTAYSLVADSLLVPGSINGSVLIQDGTIEAKNIKIGNGEILTELLKARKIVTDDVEAGQFKGYVFTGSIFQSSESENTGIKLNDNSLQMWDSTHNQTVYLDGEGKSNVLTGTFQTRTSGHRVRISPNYVSHTIGSSEDYIGDGLEFPAYKDSTAYFLSPTITSKIISNQVGEMSGMDLWSGHVAQHDPASFLLLQSKPRQKGGTGKDGVTSKVYAVADTDYDEPDIMQKSRAYLTLNGDANEGSNAWLEAEDGNGHVGVGANINTGYVYLGGFLGGFTNRQTFQGQAAWRAWWPNSGSTIASGAASQVNCTLSPTKYGRYFVIANADSDWAGIIAHPTKTGGQSGFTLKLYNADVQPCPVDIWAEFLAYLVK